MFDTAGKKSAGGIVFLAVRVWTFPNTLLGLTIGFLGVCCGGQSQRVDGCVEFHGGVVAWFLRKMPLTRGAAAMTLGHTILGQSKDALEVTREHEHVHVRQYERWGPFFVPAYFVSSFIAWITGRDPYRDNIFEIEAFENSSS